MYLLFEVLNLKVGQYIDDSKPWTIVPKLPHAFSPNNCFSCMVKHVELLNNKWREFCGMDPVYHKIKESRSIKLHGNFNPHMLK